MSKKEIILKLCEEYASDRSITLKTDFKSVCPTFPHFVALCTDIEIHFSQPLSLEGKLHDSFQNVEEFIVWMIEKLN